MIRRIIEAVGVRLVRRPRVAEAIRQVLLEQPAVFGDPSRITIARSAIVHNALFNVACGRIVLGEDVMFGHNVCLLTGTHDYSRFGIERLKAVPQQGRDIIVDGGVWIASNATVLGPVRIGAHAVVAASSLVIDDVPAFSVVAGVPAKVIRKIEGAVTQPVTS